MSDRIDRVLVTGAAGGVAGHIRARLRQLYPRLRLSDVKPAAALAANEEFVAADLGDLAALRIACAGVDGIVHLGGVSVENDWERILAGNIVGTRNLFEAARLEGVRRVVFASSNHVMGFYPRGNRVGTEAPPRPDLRYGVSKAFGEAVGAFYADKFGLRVLAIRIGNVDLRPVDERRLSIWVHPDDLVQLLRIGLEHPDLHYEIVYGMSDNARAWWDNAAAHRLGYRPQARGEDHRDAALAAQGALAPDPLGDLYQGGGFVSAEFSGDPERLLGRGKTP